MAAEAIAFGASVVGFIGLAGQILQGCLFVQDFLEALEDAPADIEALQSELVIFQTSIDKFQATLNVVDDDAIGEDVRLALEYSNKAINDLRKVVSKLADRRHGCITNFSMVVRKVRISRHVKTLERAWMLLLCAQMNMSMWVQ
jgi:D-mannonate dehydratase